MDTSPIQYETLVAEFENGLLNALRGHRVGFDYLEIWVPDEDPVKGILNMAESAEALSTPDIAVAVRRSTLPAARDGELLALLSQLGSASITPAGDGVVVNVRGLGMVSALRDVHHGLRDGLLRRLADLKHEGLRLEPHDGLVRVAVEEGPAQLCVLVEPDAGHIVRAACHVGARTPVERAILDALCSAILDTPVDDAADHGAIRAMASLHAVELTRPVAGVLHPVNADPAFVPVVRMAHAIRDDYWARMNLPPRYNEFDQLPSASWLGLDAAERMSRISAAIAAFLTEAGLTEGDIRLLRIDDDLHGQPVRILVTFGNGVAPKEKPPAMRALERALKRGVDQSLQLYHEQLKDQNAIRRL
ncbi:hypothetical protein HUE56_00805 (plasmid) [Azospirillum oryzae]|uniref:Uncharacterized protein n=1 Tax=Azospirillum oryzae TaxID=286727 RepID=A0A6N1ALB6_9PROT|nr:hypothetical protein [Azospirillum oryzae]KAA0586636.1 hypothetical protein FZ938_20790 [Azospirillum oryzae]QKS49082.1 hypothetical protein HUE56_00805 [Azospirillum oryzae]GLR80777.1 hypothetical protein GCM10007856_34570 [Azospirillum oryzae]